jgi:short-subunit dehydrogenase
VTLPAKTLAVVTGATVGIGQVFAERLARRGHNLLLIARDAERLNTVAAEVSRAHGVSARVMPADLARDDDLERVALALAGEPDLGVMVNNAGFGTKGRIHDSDLEPQMRMVRLHVLALMRLSQAVLPGMVARKRGWLINVSSIAGWLYSPGNANYNATKGYQRQFTQALNTELTGTGVYVQALCPGFTHTDFHRRVGIDKSTIPGFLWSSAGSVVDASIRAAERGRPLVLVPGFTNKVLTLLARMAPHAVLRRGRPGAR